MRASIAGLRLLSVCILLQLSGVEAGADIVGAWKKMNAQTNAQPAVAHSNHPSLTCQAIWKTNFYNYNDNSYFYIEPWTTNNFAKDVSATNYNNRGKPVTNYITFVFAISNGFKLSLTNFITRAQNDERSLHFRFRSSVDNFHRDLITFSTDHTTTTGVSRYWMATTNRFVTYTNALDLMDVTNSTLYVHMYGVTGRSQWVYAYFTNTGNAASDYMWKFEGEVRRRATVLPPRGPLVGGTMVSITNLVGAVGNGSDITNVTVDGVSVAAIHAQGTNWLRITVPPGNTPGDKDIRIYSTSTGMSEFVRDYGYNPTGQVTGLSPPTGDAVGGYPVAIVGSNLCDGTDVTNVLFGSTSLTPSSQSATQVVVTAPAGSGTVGIRIYSTSYGETYRPSVFTYTSAVAGATINFGAGELYQSTNVSSYMPLGGRINILALNTGTWGSASAIANVFSNLTDGFVPPGATLVGEIFNDNSGGSGVAGGSFSFNYSGDFDPGDQLLMVAYPTLTSSSTNPGNGTAGFFFRTESIIDGSDMAWIAPAAGGEYNLYAYTINVGGSLPNDQFTAGAGALGGSGFTTKLPEPSSQTITNFLPADGSTFVMTSTVGLSASASSGLPVSFSVQAGPGSISGGTNLTFSGAGDVLVVAAQAGNASYAPAPSVTNMVKVFSVTPDHGPFAGGNSVTVSNGHFGAITNVLVGGAAAGIQASGVNWVRILVPAYGGVTLASIVIQSSGGGETTLSSAYTYNPPGVIGGGEGGGDRWCSVGQANVPGQASAVGANNAIYGLAYDSVQRLLYAGGSFTNIGGTNCNRVAMWNGTGWTNMGVGVQQSANVICVASSLNGGAFFGGYFTNIGGTGCWAIAKWNGTNYMGFGARGLNFSTNVNGYANCILPRTNGEVIAGGYFTNANWSATGVNYIAKWTGTGWTNMQEGFRNVVNAIAEDRNGVIYVGGGFTNHYPTNTSRHMNYIAKWDGNNWTNMAGGFNNRVNTMAVDSNNVLYVGGWFTNAYRLDGTRVGMRFVAKWDGNNWTNVGNDSFNNWVYSLVFDRKGRLFAGGSFTNANGYGDTRCAAACVARWDGNNWTNVGGGVNDTVHSLVADPDSDTLYVGGQFKIANVLDLTANTSCWYVAKVVSDSGPGVYPVSGSITGGYPITITGTNLGSGSDVTNVTVCGAPVASIVTQSATQLVVVAGVADPGLGDVRVFSTGYGETVASNTFTYLGAMISLLGTNGVAVTNGAAPSLSAGTDFGSVSLGQTVTNRLSITNGGNEELIVSWTTNGSAAFAVVEGPSTVAPGTVSNLWVQFTSSGGSSTAALHLVHNALDSSLVVNLAGGVAMSDQTITFPAIGDKVTTDKVGLAATASSGLPVSFAVASGPASISGDTNLTFSGAGSVSIVASQAGDASWNPAPNVTNTFNVTKAIAAIYLGSLSQTYDGMAKSVTATTDPAGLTVEFTYDGNAWAPTNVGSYAVTGTVNDTMWQGSAAGTLVIGLAGQTITFPAIAPQKPSASVGLAATASSGLPVTFAADPPGAISDGTNLTFSGVGDVRVVASQAGDGSWNAAPSVTNIVKVFSITPDNGPFAGGNSIMVSNGHFGTITNVLVGGAAAGIQASGANWVTITIPAVGSAGVKDLVIQTSDIGETTLAGAYDVNPAGVIGINNEDWGQWMEVTGMPLARAHGGAGMLDDRMFLAGGVRAYSTYATNSASFDGAAWALAPHMPTNTMHFGAAVYNGSFYVVGGHAGLSPTRQVFRYDGSAWVTSAPLPLVTSMGAAGSMGSYLYMVGGHDGSQGNTRTNAYRFDGASWSEAPGLPVRRFSHRVAEYNGALYALGGKDETGTAQTNVFRFDGSTWTEVAGLPEAKSQFATATLRGELYVVAGMVGYNGATSVHRFDGTNWLTATNYPLAVSGLLAAEVDNYLYAAGGTTDDFFDYKTNVYRYPAGTVEAGVTPETGSVIGGYLVTITGTNLGNGVDITNVTLCGVSAASIVSQSATQIVIVAGVADPGLGDVRVYSTSFGETVKPNAFTYLREIQAPLTFAPASPQTYLTTNALSTSGGSGTGAVSYAVTAGPGSIVGGTNLALTAGTGMVTVVATKAQDDRYFATAATALVAAARAGQTITFPAMADQLTTNQVGLEATASSGLFASFSVFSGPASIDGSTNLTFTGTGTVSIVASQAGDTNWTAAADVTNTFTVTKATAGVYLGSLSQTYDGTAKSVTATTDPAGLTVEFTYDGNAWAPTNTGSYAVTGTVNDVMWQGSAAGTLVIGLAGQTIAFPAIAPQKLSASVGLAATASSGFSVTFAADPPGSISNGTNLTFSGVGDVRVVASQAGDGTYEPAPDVTNIVKVFSVTPDSGPFAGGNSVTINNGSFGTITNVLVGGVAASIQLWGANWVAITTPAVGAAGVQDIVVQTDSGDITLPDAYTVNPAGLIGSSGDWSHWVDTVGMPVSILGTGVGVLSNRLFAVGGQGAEVQTNVYCFDGTNWTEIAGLPAARQYPMVGVINGSLYSAGGHTWVGTYTNVYRYTGSGWLEVDGLPELIWDQAGAVYSGALYAIGGELSGFGIRTNVYRFDGTSWSEVAGLPVARRSMGAAASDGYLYAVGGETMSEQCTNVYRFNGATWTEVAGLPMALSRFGMAELDGALYAAGGQDAMMMEAYTNVYRFDGSSWTQVAGLPVPRRSLSLATLDGVLYSVGGVALATNVYRYPAAAGSSGVSPSMGSWTGGYLVTITGTNLGNGVDITNVTLCGVSAASIVSQSATQIVIVAGVADPGLGDVRVYSTSFGETVKPNAFTYLREIQAPLSFAPTSPQTYLTTNALSASGGSGTGAVSYAVTAGPGTIIGGTNLAITAGTGMVTVVATKAQDDRYFAASATALVAAARAEQIITFPAIADQVFTNSYGLSATSSSGLAPAFSVLSGPASLSGGTNLTFSGTGQVQVVASQSGNDDWLPAPEVTNTFAATKAQAAVTLTNLAQTYNGTAREAGSLTEPPGLTVVFTYDGNAWAPTNAGSYTVTGIVQDVDWQGSATGTLVVGRATDTITFSQTNHVYNGAARSVVAEAGSGSAVDVTYDGSGTAPVNAGTYAVTGVVDALNWQATNTTALTITRANQTITFPEIAGQTTTSQVGLAATASSGLFASFSVFSGPASISGGTNLTFSGAGAVSIVASQAGDTNWIAAADVTNTFAVTKATAAVYLGSLSQTYDGSAKSVTATTDPSGLTVTFTYDGHAWAPTNTGSYAVTGTVNDTMWQGSAAGTLVIGLAGQTITFPAIAPQKQSASVGLSATASSGLSVTFAADPPGIISDGTNLTFSGAGDVRVVASQAGDGTYETAPSVTNLVKVFSVTPDNGPFAGGNSVTVSNGHFGTITNVLVGGTAAGIHASGVNWVTLTAPSLGTAGVQDIVVQTSDNGDTTLNNAYTYNPAGQIDGVEPISGSWSGGYQVVISGSNLCDGVDVTNVTLRGVEASIQSQSATQIVIVAGVADPGLGDIRVFSTSFGETILSNAFTYLRESQAALLFTPSSPQTYLTTNGLSASGGSGTGAVSYAVLNGPGLIAGGTNLAMMSGTGTVTVVATKAQDDLYVAASVTAQVAAARAGQTISFPVIGDQLTTNRVGLGATSSSGLFASFSVFSGPASIADGTNLTFSGAGSVSIVASQEGDTNWTAAANVTNTFMVSLTPQASLVFAPATPQTYHTTNLLSASGGSGTGAVSYAVLGGPGQIVGGTNLVATSGTGEIVLEATRAADAMYLVQMAVATVTVAKANQTLDFTALGDQFWTNRIGLAATASSALSASFSVFSGPASITDGTNLSFSGYGPVELRVNQAGDTNFNAAPTVTNRFNALGPILSVSGSADLGDAIISLQTITNVLTFTNAGSAQLSIASVVTNGDQASSFSLRLTSSVIAVSSVVHVPVVFDPKAGGSNLASFVITFDGTNSPYTVNVSGVGLGGGIRLATNAIAFAATYMGTNPVNQTVGMTNVGVSSFTYTNLVGYSAGASDWLSSLPGGGTVGLGGSTLLTNLVNLAGLNAGTHSATVTVTAADATNSPQAYVVELVVDQAPQAISFPNPGSQWTTNVTPISATATSGLPVSFEVVSGPATLVNGSNVTYSASGTVVIRALQAGDSNWLAAASVTNVYDVAKTPQASLVFAPATPQTYHTTNLLSASGGSGTGAVSYAVLGGPGQIVGGTNLVATSGTGEIVLEATRAADAMYLVQMAVATVTVAKANQTLDFTALGDQFWTNRIGLAATASSALSASFSVFSGPASIADGTNLSFSGYGPVELRVNQAGDTNFNAAPTVTNRFNALGPILSVSGTHDFGSALIGLETVTNLFTLTNSGNALLSIASVVTNGAQASSFRLALTSSAISASSVVHLPVVFDPKAGGSNLASFVITFDGTNSPYTVDVTGFGYGGAIGFSTDMLAFGCTYLGADPADQSIVLTNKGSSPITWTNAIAYSAGAADWLTVTPNAGHLADASAVQLTATVDATNLNAGTYYATNTVTAPESTNSPKTWVVTLVVDKAPQAISFPVISDQYITNEVGLAATPSSGLFATFSVFSGPASLSGGTNLSFSATGAVAVVASQAGDTNWLAAPGVTNRFVVHPLKPTISDPFAVDSGVTTAGLGATIHDVFGAMVSERGIVWSVTNGFAAETGTRVSALGLFGTGIFTQQVSNLVSGVTNFYRAYAVNHAGTTYTAQAWTLMRPEAPVLEPATQIGPNSFQGNWQAARGALDYRLDVAEDEVFTLFVAGFQDLDVGEVTSLVVTGLQPGLTYYYRLRARNDAGFSTNTPVQSVITAPRLTMVTWPRAAGDTVPASGSYLVDFNVPVDISATARSGYQFAGWQQVGGGTLADPGARTTTVTLVSNAIVTAYFMEPSLVSMTVTRWRTNWGTGTLFADLRFCNIATNGNRLTGPVWYGVFSNSQYYLRQAVGTMPMNGYPYVVVTPSLYTQHVDHILDPGECFTVTNVEFYSRTFRPPTNLLWTLAGVVLPHADLVDTDGDEIPDVWEGGHRPGDELDPLNGMDDPDEDGFCTRDEWIANTHPGDPQSHLHVAAVALAGGDGRLLSWPSSTGRVYGVSAATNAMGPYLRIAEGVPAHPPSNTATDHLFSAESEVFYRIEVWIP